MNAVIVTFLAMLFVCFMYWLCVRRESRHPVVMLTLAWFAGSCAVAALSVLSSCSAPPPTPAQTAKIATDLCGLRALERAVLQLDPKLQPPPDSIRARVQATEDRLCANLADGGAPPPAPS